ncbi:MAG: SMP-30/gluconolactonase/LRE family protein [Luteitalea sp.]|nr:SMP-30/gluconolactonase/LRE family protein [Luteitalea sp.]
MSRRTFCCVGIMGLLAASGASGQESASPAPQQLQVAATVAFLEGPTSDSDGNVFFTDLNGGRILKLAAEGGRVTTYREPSNRANGLLFDPEGRLLACEGGDRAQIPPRVTRTDMKTGQVEVLADNYQGQRFNSPNDITYDGKGRLYFTDLAGGAVYRIDPDKKLTRILARPEIDRPNGLAISPDDRTFYLIEANQAEGGPRMIRAYDLAPDGTVANMRVFHNFYPGRSGDGMCIDSQGSLYVAAGLNRTRGTSETLATKAGIHVFSSSGKLLDFFPVHEDSVTNCGFAGPDLKTLYVTAGKLLLKMQTTVAGTRR